MKKFIYLITIFVVTWKITTLEVVGIHPFINLYPEGTVSGNPRCEKREKNSIRIFNDETEANRFIFDLGLDPDNSEIKKYKAEEVK